MSLRLVLQREIPDDPHFQNEWNRLALQMERPQVFYSCEWALAVQASYQASLKPLLLLGYVEEELVGVASLATDADETTVTFLAANTADYCDFLTHPSRRAEFVTVVFAELRKIGAQSIVLANLPEDSATPDALGVAAAKNRFYTYIRPAYACAQVELGSGQQREDLKVSLTGKKKLRKYIRAMEREGPVTFVHLGSYAEITKALPAFADAHVARFRATGRVSSLTTPERRLFLEELARRFSNTEVVTLSQLLIGSRAVAWNYGFRFQGSWFWYQPTFDSAQEQNSPGHCLLSRIVLESCDLDEMKVVDMGLGAEGYKERFGNSTRQTLYVTATKYRFSHWSQIARYRAASLLKRVPRLEVVVRRLLGR